ncbi:MAG: hypothetical protein ACSHXB_00940 [Sulfitobacter sp.]
MQRPLQALHFEFSRNREHPFGFHPISENTIPKHDKSIPSPNLIAPI